MSEDQTTQNTTTNSRLRTASDQPVGEHVAPSATEGGSGHYKTTHQGCRIAGSLSDLLMHDQPKNTATFYQYEIEMLINRALAIRDPLIMRSWRWVRWSKKVAASDAALFRFHEYAAAALTRFSVEEYQNGR